MIKKIIIVIVVLFVVIKVAGEIYKRVAVNSSGQNYYGEYVR